MKKIIKRVVITIAVIILVLVAILVIQWFYRSKAESIKDYETTNTQIRSLTGISAHRCGGGTAPEETLMAFKRCVEEPDYTVDYFEFDLHITKDDVLILLHDDTLDRTSNCEEVFGETDVHPEDKTLAELKRLNMGAKFTTDDGETPFADLEEDEVPEDLRIVTLEEVLGYLEDNGDFEYIIEIKNDGELGEKAMDILHKCLKEQDLLNRTVVSSFNKDIASYAEENYTDIIRGACTSEAIKFFLAVLTKSGSYVPDFEVLQLPFDDLKECYCLNLGTAGLINYAHEHDLAVQYWTIDDEKDAQYLLDLKADCIMTDYPKMVYEEREAMKESDQ